MRQTACCHLDCQSDAPENFPPVSDSEKLVVLGGGVELRRLLVNKECVWDPDEVDVVSANNKLVNSRLKFYIRKKSLQIFKDLFRIKHQALVSPKLSIIVNIYGK